MNPSTALARAILAELVHQGVRELVLAPGSRSAPLAFAALRLAEAGVLRLHVRVDERSAGFLALGLAKVSGAPVAVVCTSGTAVANLAPAVVEASYSAVPLVLLTADRPVESRGVGAPQTIDQVQFFGGAVRFFADLAAPRRADPDDPEVAQRAARASVGMAIAAAIGAGAPGAGVPGSGSTVPGGRGPVHPGPVHLNVGFRLPLVPEPSDVLAADLPPVPGGTESPPRPRRPPLDGCDYREIGELLGDVPARGLVLVGDLPCAPLRGHHQWLAELAAACGWPIISEPSANLHDAPTALGHGVLVLGSSDFLADHTPDLVVTAGLFGLSRATLELVRRARRHVALDLPSAGREVCDPMRTADLVLSGIPLPPTQPEVDPAWWAAWRTADAVAAAVVSQALGDPRVLIEPERGGVPAAPAGMQDGPGPLTGAAVASRVWELAPDDALMLVAASWPVRQVEAFGGRRGGLRVIGNRGANGIDGLVSTAWGAALAHQQSGGGPAVALLGDLALLHDHNGLLVGPGEARPDLLILVIDNDGGGIFHQLEQGRPEHAAAFERLFGTPLGRDLVAVSRAAGVPAQRVSDLVGLESAMSAALSTGGVRVVIADAPDRAGEARLLEAVRTEVARRLRPAGQSHQAGAAQP